MAIYNKSSSLTFAVLLIVTAFSCSMPLFTGVKNAKPLEVSQPSKLSGLLQMEKGCELGYYQIRLQGLFQYSAVAVEAQSDEKGHFSLIAPPGKYLMIVSKGDCGNKQAIDLEGNTEHLVSVFVSEVKSHEVFSQKELKDVNRLPASVLIEDHP